MICLSISNVNFIFFLISNDIFSTKIYDKRDDFDFEISHFPFLDGDVPLVRGLTCFKNSCKTLGYMKLIVCKIIPGWVGWGGGQNHIYHIAY